MYHRFKCRLVAAALGGAAALLGSPSSAGAFPPSVGLARPDLQITRVLALAEGPGFLVRVENAGHASSRPTRVVLWTNASGAGDRRKVEADVVALPPDSLAFVRLVPRTDAGCEPGPLYSFRVDPDGLVEESVEFNNDAVFVAP